MMLNEIAEPRPLLLVLMDQRIKKGESISLDCKHPITGRKIVGFIYHIDGMNAYYMSESGKSFQVSFGPDADELFELRKNQTGLSTWTVVSVEPVNESASRPLLLDLMAQRLSKGDQVYLDFKNPKSFRGVFRGIYGQVYSIIGLNAYYDLKRGSDSSEAYEFEADADELFDLVQANPSVWKVVLHKERQVK